MRRTAPSRHKVRLADGSPGPKPRSGNLPPELNTFVGRAVELATLRSRLDDSRLVTITGPPGVGKSRLAAHLAHELGHHLAQGGWLIELSSLEDPNRVPELSAHVLGLRPERVRDWTSVLVDYLGAWDALLVIDNCEHLLLAAGRLIQQLLTRCSRVRIIATSRERLRLGGEVVWPLAPLPSSDATALFIDRARAISPDFDVKLDLVSRICQRLEGIPLAIELAAAHAEAMPLEAIEERLGQRLQLLTGGERTASPRKQTLRGALEWSYALLDEPQRRLFRRTAIFVDGFDLDAVEAVCADVGQSKSRIDGELVALVDKSLVRRDGRRYHLLETMREFAEDRLLEAQELDRMRRAHALHYAAFGELAAAQRCGGNETWWVDHLWTDRANLLAGLEWACVNDPDAAARIAIGLALMWWVRGDYGGATTWLEKVVGAPAQDPVLRALETLEAATFADTFGHRERARAHYAAALAIATQVDHPLLLSRCLGYSGLFLMQEGATSEGRARLVEALRIARELNRPGWTATVAAMLGIVALTVDQDLAVARAHFAEAVDLCREAGWERGLPMGLTLLGAAAMIGSDDRLTEKCVGEAVEVCRRNDEHQFAPYSVDLAAALAARHSAYARAVTLWAAAAQMRSRLGTSTLPGWKRRMAEFQKVAEGSLSSKAIAVAAEAGRAMDHEQALDYAGQVVSAKTVAKRLTRRELEVASFVGKGLSARQIATRLYLSERTVESHLERIREKLGVHSRSEIAAWVAQEHWLGKLGTGNQNH